MNYYRRQLLIKKLFIISIVLLSFILLYATIKLIFTSDKQNAKKAIIQFYEYEQAGQFSSSWEMFHPYMQLKFPKNDYIQDRAHVFLNHFNIEAFKVTFNKLDKVKSLAIDNGHESLSNVYKMPIVMTINGKYGNLKIHQDVYAVKVDKKWRILWHYD